MLLALCWWWTENVPWYKNVGFVHCDPMCHKQRFPIRVTRLWLAPKFPDWSRPAEATGSNCLYLAGVQQWPLQSLACLPMLKSLCMTRRFALCVKVLYLCQETHTDIGKISPIRMEGVFPLESFSSRFYTCENLLRAFCSAVVDVRQRVSADAKTCPGLSALK